MASFFSRSVHFLFKKNLLATNCITSGLFMGLGDLIQQEIEFKSGTLPKRYDWIRTSRMTIVGVAMGPFHHYFYIYMDTLLPGSSVKTVVKKVFYDQAICSPLTIFFFFYGMGLLEMKSIQDCNTEIHRKFKLAYMVDWLYWPPVQCINFYYVPSPYRVFYINVATMVYDVFLSFVKHFDHKY